MQKVQSDDIYVFTYLDQADNSIGTSVVESLEDFEKIHKAVKVISWINIIGKEMSIGNFNLNESIVMEKVD